jgi:DnaJ-class molecular chaperone
MPHVQCEYCKGSGRKPYPCPECRGDGYVGVYHDLDPYKWVPGFRKPCPLCRGQGVLYDQSKNYDPSKDCPNCVGRGTLWKDA